MRETPESRTSVTLLDRICRDPTDEAAWREFVRFYGARVVGWCRGWGLQLAITPVYVAKHRVEKLLRDEVQRLDT